MSTHRSTWKKGESKVAGAFDAKRNIGSGSMGRDDHSASDSTHSTLFIETKLRQEHAILKVWRKSVKLAKKEGKTPMVAMLEKNKPGFWVLCHIDHLPIVAAEYAKARHSQMTRELEGQSNFLDEGD